MKNFIKTFQFGEAVKVRLSFLDNRPRKFPMLCFRDPFHNQIEIKA